MDIIYRIALKIFAALYCGERAVLSGVGADDAQTWTKGMNYHVYVETKSLHYIMADGHFGNRMQGIPLSKGGNLS